MEQPNIVLHNLNVRHSKIFTKDQVEDESGWI